MGKNELDSAHQKTKYNCYSMSFYYLFYITLFRSLNLGLLKHQTIQDKKAAMTFIILQGNTFLYAGIVKVTMQ